jgi:hypothetical protein
MSFHQLVIPTTTIVLPNVLVQQIQVMNSSFGHMAIFVNYQPTQQPPLTPFVPSKTNVVPTFTYPMWYNVMPLYILSNPSLYLAYPFKMRRFYPLISKNYIGYIPRYVHLVSKKLVIPLIQTLR